MRTIIIVVWALLLVGCVTPVTPVTQAVPPPPVADAAPTRPAQTFVCDMVGNETGFDLACAEPTPTPAPTPTIAPTPAPSFHYLFCAVGDSLCWGTPWRIWWNPEKTHLRCAVNVTTDTNGAKVTVLGTIAAERAPGGKALTWIRTGWMSGNETCDGWIESDRVLAAQ